jgi:steroid 5-alpha reductase family enzyme
LNFLCAVFWLFQMIWAWGVCLPVVFVNSDAAQPPQDGRDWAGLAMFVVGFVIEVIADAQKDVFRADPSNKGRVCDVGLW